MAVLSAPVVLLMSASSPRNGVAVAGIAAFLTNRSRLRRKRKAGEGEWNTVKRTGKARGSSNVLVGELSFSYARDYASFALHTAMTK